METKCISGRPAHAAFVTADEPMFDARYLDKEAVQHTRLLPSQYGYCETCYTAMRWDVDAQRIVDWPEANTVPHCSFCGVAVPAGGHYIADFSLNIETYQPMLVRVRDVYVPPPIENAIACGPMCVIHAVLDDERLKDVFGR